MTMDALKNRGFLSAIALSFALAPAIALAQTAPPSDASDDDDGQRGEAPNSSPRRGAVPSGQGGGILRPKKKDVEPEKAPLVKPKIVHFENADYPQAAIDAAVSGVVVLSLAIDPTGAVTEAKIHQGLGYGLDEAARDAALKFQWSPATVGGKPVPVKILFPYRFTLAEPEAAEPEPPPTVGNLIGTILVAGAEQPLAGAEVILVKSGGTTQTTLTGADGKFVFSAVLAGAYQLQVQAAGFEPVDLTETVVAGEETDVTYRVAATTEELEVTVVADRPPREVTRRTIDRRQMSRIPGTSGDALRSLQRLPGVARPPGLIGFLVVRGSAPQDTRAFISGAEFPLVYHFGGLSSVIPTELLDRIDFYPGNFSAKYGRLMGGIIDVELREPDTQCHGDFGDPLDTYGCFHGMAQFDLIDMRVMLQGPIAGDWTFAAAARRSWIDVWLTPALEAADAGVTSAPVYHDYQIIAETKPTPRSRLSLRFIASDDELELLIKNPPDQEPGFGGNLRFATSFTRAQILYRNALSKSVDLDTMVSVGSDIIDFSIASVQFQVEAMPVHARSEFGFKIADGIRLNTGLDFQIAPYDVYVRAPPPPRPGEPAPGPFTLRPVSESHESGLGFRPSWYAEAEVRPVPKWLLVPGLRADYARDSGQGEFSPRLMSRYDLFGGSGDRGTWTTQGGNAEASDAGTRRTTLKGGAGVFRQPPEYQETDPVFGTPGVDSNRSIHYSVGVEQEITEHLELGVEGYYKDMQNLVSRGVSATGDYEYNNEGSGYVIGLETLFKYKPDKRFFGWLAYTLSRSIRQNGPDDDEYLMQFDQTHVFTILGNYRLGHGWEVGARWRYVSGPLTSPVQSSLPALYAADAAAYTPLRGDPFSRRLPNFHAVDVRIDKAWQYKSWRLSAYMDVQNAYNNPATEQLLYNYNFTKERYQTGLPLIPSFGLRGEF